MEKDNKNEHQTEKEKQKRRVLTYTVVLLVIAGFSIIAVYFYHTTESRVVETCFLILIAILLILIWRNAEKKGVGIEHFPNQNRKKKESIHRAHIKESRKTFEHVPHSIGRRRSGGRIPDYNIGLADKHRVEEGMSEELLQSIEANFTGRRVLLVEDHDTNRDIAAYILTNIGFEVEVAENGKEAVNMVKRSKHGYYDVILMDIMMPVMDGYEATKAIRRLKDHKLSQIPIVALTARSSKEDIKEAKNAGMNGHVAKPIDVMKLTKAMEKAMFG